MYKPVFIEKHPETYRMLLNFFQVPPRRTLLDLCGDWEAIVLCQPEDPDQPMERHTFIYEREKVGEMLALLEERRLTASIKYDPSIEATDEERAQRQAELDASREDKAGDEKSPDNVIPLLRRGEDADTQVAAL